MLDLYGRAGERRVHILIVDDNANGRYLLQTVLESAGHRVTAAPDGERALEQARSSRPDLLITDILMPRMDGYQLCRAWKADPVLGGVPLAFYTASYTDPADERFATGLGADAFWRKPMEPRELLRRVEELGSAAAAPAREPELTDEAAVLKQYNARLVEKLEEKAHGLELANVELRATGEQLAHEVAMKEQLIAELSADVAERRRVEAELRRERDFSRQVLEVADLFVCILDVDLKVILFSAGAERITGFRAEEVAGHSAVERFVSAPSRDRVRGLIASLECGDVVREEIDIATADGGGATLECAIACAGNDGVARSYNIFGVDVTERRRLEQLKSEFIQMVSHELRTPLTSIVGFTDVLGAARGDRLAEQAPVIAERLRQNADRMRTLVEELLEVNDIAAEGVTLFRSKTDLGAVVRRSAEAVFRTPGHPLTVEISPDLPPVPCDSERIGRVVTNLVSNAVKYSPDGGPVRVRVWQAGAEAVITVADEGMGIATDEIDGLFDRFTQADMSSTRVFGGIGLGLYIVDAIVRAHGGTVRVESAPGVGSTFEVRLPVSSA